MLQGVDEHLHSTGNLTLGIGVLHTEEEHAAGLVRHALGGQALHQVAQVDKARGRGGHTGDHCALRQLTLGIMSLQILWGIGHVGK